MCVFDIFGSIGWAFSTMPIPRGSNCTFGAFGNQATCITQGFMISLGLAVPTYNAMLCVYYLLVVKYNMRDEAIAKYEPLMHFISICPPLSVSIIAAANDLFNNYSQFCWIVDRDNYEVDLDRIEDENTTLVSVLMVFTVIFAALVLLVIIYCMINIYKFVKSNETRMSTYQFQRPTTNYNTSPRNTTPRRSSLSNDVIDTKVQAYLYVGSFILTYLFPTITLGFDHVLKSKCPYQIWLLQGLLGPLQGFWNFLTYVRPKFNVISRQHNDKNILRRLCITVLHKPEADDREGRRRSFRSRRRRHSI